MEESMEAELWKIATKRSDFKRCKECGCFNWYENEECHNCCSKKFGEVMQKDIENEFKFWIEQEGYSESETEDVLYDV